MSAKRKKVHQEKDLTSRFLTGQIDDDRLEQHQRFSQRSANAEKRKMEKTALLRAAEEELSGDVNSLPTGQVIQVYSLFCDVEFDKQIRLCVVRKTLSRLAETGIVVGDLVRFRDTGSFDEQGRPEAVIEEILPRKTVLTRADSFNAIDQQPIVANAEQMLIVASLLEPHVKWGLVDRMLIACLSGGLSPVICINKIDLEPKGREVADEARAILGHYESLGYPTVLSSVPQGVGLTVLADRLRGKSTVLAGHSGVGKSSLINTIQPHLNIRTQPISGYTGKGRHTTTSARRYVLDFGGYVIDTPGVKMFGLWGVSRENLLQFFPDVEAETAPPWRAESYERILESLPAE